MKFKKIDSFTEINQCFPKLALWKFHGLQYFRECNVLPRFAGVVAFSTKFEQIVSISRFSWSKLIHFFCRVVVEPPLLRQGQYTGNEHLRKYLCVQCAGCVCEKHYIKCILHFIVIHRYFWQRLYLLFHTHLLCVELFLGLFSSMYCGLHPQLSNFTSGITRHKQ
jgi:hypothetical protein